MRRRERGAASLEVSGAIAVVALLVVGIVAVAPGQQIAPIIDQAVCTVKTMSPCFGAAAPQQAALPPADTGDRNDQERQARDSRRGRGEDKAPDSADVDGQDNGGSALGPPVDGTSVTEPSPPPWSPPDGGAGEYDSQRAWPWDHAKKLAVETAANALSGKWPDAARNLLHFLANTGEPLDQDVNRILADVPQLQQQVDDQRTSLGEDAVERARQAGVSGPVTFSVNTDWQGYYIGPDQSANWYYALGGVSYNQTGQVTVHPPTSPGGPWRYEVSTRVNLFDQYNWDGGKKTEIGPITVTDETLADLHRQGLAREYRNQGSSDHGTAEGTVP